MGVAGFVSFLTRSPVFRKIFLQALPTNIEALFIEINALIYQEKAKLFTEKNLTPAEYHKRKEAVFQGVYDEIERLTTLINPSTLLYLSVDGVAPLAKIMQQRQRRYLSTLEDKVSDFDSTQISPSTNFMFELDAFLTEKLANSKLAPQVIYDPHDSQGEGEHKIANFLRSSPLKNVVIHGLDADLFMINLPIVEKYKKQIILYRETNDEQNRIHIANLTFMNVILKALFKSDRAAEEFTLLMFLIGNDFLPRFTVFERTDEALQTLIAGYKEYREDTYNNNSVVDDSGISWIGLRNFLDFLEERGYFRILLETWALNADFKVKVISPLANSNVRGKRFDVATFNTQYYNYVLRPRGFYDPAFRVSDIDKYLMSRKYLQGVDWAFGYYMNGGSTTGYRYFYPYFYPPLIQDFKEHIKFYARDPDSFNYDHSTEFPHPLEQLLMIIPIQSKDIVPKRLQILYDYKSSPVYDLLPMQFIVDKEGKTKAHDQIALVPFPQYSRIQAVIKLLKLDAKEEAKYANKPVSTWKFQVTRSAPVKLPTLSGNLGMTISDFPVARPGVQMQPFQQPYQPRPQFEQRSYQPRPTMQPRPQFEQRGYQGRPTMQPRPQFEQRGYQGKPPMQARPQFEQRGYQGRPPMQARPPFEQPRTQGYQGRPPQVKVGLEQERRSFSEQLESGYYRPTRPVSPVYEPQPIINSSSNYEPQPVLRPTYNAVRPPVDLQAEPEIDLPELD